MLTYVALHALRVLADRLTLRCSHLCERAVCGRSQIEELRSLGLADVFDMQGDRWIELTKLGRAFLSETERWVEEAV